MKHPPPTFISKKVKSGDYFFLDLNPSNGDSLTVTCGGIETCEEGYLINRRSFPYFGLEYVVSGSCEVKIMDRKTTLRAGHLFAYAPNTPLRITKVGNHSLVKYFVDFVGSESAELLAKLQSLHEGVVHLANSAWLSQNFGQLLAFGKSQQPECCSLLLRLILKQIPEYSPLSEDSSSASLAHYQKALTLLNRHYADFKDLGDLANACHVSNAYLCRVFKNHHHESPAKALTRRKMEVAANFLINGGFQVKQVAHKTGYEDPFHFSRLFKTHFGVSPKYFMEQSRR